MTIVTQSQLRGRIREERPFGPAFIDKAQRLKIEFAGAQPHPRVIDLQANDYERVQ
jgi:hypothetical protein